MHLSYLKNSSLSWNFICFLAFQSFTHKLETLHIGSPRRSHELAGLGLATVHALPLAQMKLPFVGDKIGARGQLCHTNSPTELSPCSWEQSLSRMGDFTVLQEANALKTQASVHQGA